MGPVLLDLRYTPHLMIGGATNSGKSVTLKLLLHQCAMHGMKVTIADFKGGVLRPVVAGQCAPRL